jgi:hypothetical protein
MRAPAPDPAHHRRNRTVRVARFVHRAFPAWGAPPLPEYRPPFPNVPDSQNPCPDAPQKSGPTCERNPSGPAGLNESSFEHVPHLYDIVSRGRLPGIVFYNDMVKLLWPDKDGVF